jgi:F420-dependent oxidoreductase-like protein
LLEVTVEAERLGWDSVWTAEAWGSDAFTPLGYLAAHTSSIKLGTSVVQLSARTPTATAMATLTLDHLSNGRFILGLGVSGPQVVEGWYGQPSAKPLARTREYVEIIRRVIRRDEPLDFQGEHYQHPYRGPGSVGLGKPLKAITHPLRREIPIYLGAEGPKNVTQTTEIADGWMPLYYSPFHQDVYADQLAGVTPEQRRAAGKDEFAIVAGAMVNVHDSVEEGLLPVKMMLGFYIGGMGAKGQNFHTKLMERFGYEKEAAQIQQAFFDGRRDEAIALVPDEFADAISLTGPPARIRERLQAWEESPVTTLLCYAPGSVEQLRDLTEVLR